MEITAPFRVRLSHHSKGKNRPRTDGTSSQDCPRLTGRQVIQVELAVSLEDLILPDDWAATIYDVPRCIRIITGSVS